MSDIVSTYRKLLELPLSVLVKNNPIPAQPIEELQLNINQPILYVLPYTSQTDFVIFRRNCLSVGLPDPKVVAFLNQKAQKMKPPKSSINT